jgi:hypothetical protein
VKPLRVLDDDLVNVLHVPAEVSAVVEPLVALLASEEGLEAALPRMSLQVEVVLIGPTAGLAFEPTSKREMINLYRPKGK